MVDANKVTKLLNELESLRSFREHSNMFTLEIGERLKRIKGNIALKDFSIVRDLEFVMFTNETYNKHVNEIMNLAKEIEEDV